MLAVSLADALPCLWPMCRRLAEALAPGSQETEALLGAMGGRVGSLETQLKDLTSAFENLKGEALTGEAAQALIKYMGAMASVHASMQVRRCSEGWDRCSSCELQEQP